MKSVKPSFLLFVIINLLAGVSCMGYPVTYPADQVISRVIPQYDHLFVLHFVKDNKQRDWFEVSVKNQKVHVSGNSQVALCRGAYYYYKKYCNGMITWSGIQGNIPQQLPNAKERIETPFQWRYYFNVVTHGYTTAYWDWSRWEKEIDWMALHGMNMPLIGGAHEAIMYRVFEKLGLKKSEIQACFSGPAHLPWNRMGNLSGWDGPVPDSFYPKQIQLSHKILDRLSELGMTPIIPAFAGFMPKSIQRIYPDAEIRELSWGGGLSKEYNSFILSPNSKYFIQIGKMYVQEWEKEFGKGKYYLADSFNEMDVPLSADHKLALQELAGFGDAVYQSIKQANADAIWVMQGWTFPYHRDSSGKLFWTPERLSALLSKIPDDKLLILDLANEYNKVFWKIEPSWKMYEGFFGKQWIYSFIPNMGGKTSWNGRLDVYATAATEALFYKDKRNLVGFGFAPEGIENNEIVYELLTDVAWQDVAVDLSDWIPQYCHQRYGDYPQSMKYAFELLQRSCLGSFTDHPIHRFQLRPYRNPEGVENHATVHRSIDFEHAVKAFLQCKDELRNSQLYVNDALELTAQFLGLQADNRLLKFLGSPETEEKSLDEAVQILANIDSLLSAHPTQNLRQWVSFARSWGDTEAEKQYYESNAKRLITTWGGDPVNDYAGRVWSGLTKQYYLPRWQLYHQNNWSDEQLRQWEEAWIRKPYQGAEKASESNLELAISLIDKYSER